MPRPSAPSFSSIEREIRALRSGRIGHSIRTMESVIAEETVGLAYMAVLLSIFAGVSAVFSTVGVYDAQGQIRYAHAALVDITARKMAEIAERDQRNQNGSSSDRGAVHGPHAK